MDELYNILESYKQKNDPRFIYDGLYEEPADTSINLDPMYNIGSRQFGDIRAGFPRQGIFNTAQANNITPSIIPENLLYEDFNYKYLPSANDQYESEATTTPQTKKDGIGGLFKFLLGLAVPGAGFLMNLPGRGLEGIRSLNQRLQQSDFAQADNLMDYLDMRKYGGLQGRDDAAARTMAQARGLQKQIDQRQSAVQTNQDRGRGDRPGGANYSAPSKPQRSFSSDYSEAQRARKF